MNQQTSLVEKKLVQIPGTVCSWLVSADEYYITTRMLWYGSQPYTSCKDIALYTASQSVERYLKAAILARQIEVNREMIHSGEGHNLMKLLRILMNSVNNLAANQRLVRSTKKISELTKQSRYPSGKQSYQYNDLLVDELDYLSSELRKMVDNKCHNPITELISTPKSQFHQFFTKNNRCYAPELFLENRSIQLGAVVDSDSGSTTVIPVDFSHFREG